MDTKKAGNDQAKDVKFRKVTHRDFFRLCEEIRNRREVLLNERPSLSACARDMSDRLGTKVTDKNIRDAQEATGVTWEMKLKGGGLTSKGRLANNRARTMANQIKALHGDLARLAQSLEFQVSPLTEPFIRLHAVVNEMIDSEDEPAVPDRRWPQDVTQMLAAAAVSAQAAQQDKAQANGAPAEPLPPPSTQVLKTGDEVILDGSPFKRFTVASLKGGGRFASITGGSGGVMEVKVERLRLARK